MRAQTPIELKSIPVFNWFSVSRWLSSRPRSSPRNSHISPCSGHAFPPDENSVLIEIFELCSGFQGVIDRFGLAAIPRGKVVLRGRHS